MLFRALLITIAIAPIAEATQNVVVLLDDSGSMDIPLRSNSRMLKIDAAKQALLTVLERVPDDARVGLLVLNETRLDGGWIIPLRQVDKGIIANQVRQIRAGGGTPLGEYMKTAADALLKLRTQERYGNYRLLIITDGEANDRDLVNQYLPDILNRSIQIDVIGVDMATEHSLATHVHSYRRADNAASLTQAIEESLAETNPDPNDANEQAEFELLQAWPDQLAVAAIQTLSTNNDAPIGTGEIPPISSSPRPIPNSSKAPIGLAVTILILASLPIIGLFFLVGFLILWTIKRHSSE